MDEELKLALRALHWSKPHEDAVITHGEAITAIEAALAQPVQRTWVELTDEEISDIAINNPPMVHEFAKAIEAKLRSKNT